MKNLFHVCSVIALTAFGSVGCTASPQNSFALKTAEYGQCRGLNKGEVIRYKKKTVSYVCEDKHVLLGEAYQRDDEWYFKSGKYDGKKVNEISEARVEKSIHNICHLEGTYGTGAEHIRMFYYNTKISACLPFDWSGKDGIAPFDSQDACEKHCYY